MSKLFLLTRLLPKPQQDHAPGCLNIDQKTKDAAFLTADGECILETMDRCQIVWAAKGGITISGFETIGTNKNLTPKYQFQQWYLAYVDNKMAA